MANSGSNPPTTVAGNLQGTLAGFVATIAVGAISHAGYLAIAASFLGVPEATLCVVAMAVIGGAANYAVTHYAGLKSYADLYAAIPTTYQEYPSEKSTEGTPTNLSNGS